MKNPMRWQVLTVMAGAAVWAMFGCETVEPVDKELQIEPSSTNLTAAGQTVVFQAVVNAVTNLGISATSTNKVIAGPPVMIPLRWSVSDPALGRIRASGGFTAVYERNGDAVGNNYVLVQDAAGRYEGVATVTQLPVP
ncbi:MAG: hypothetical protein N2652_08895 [Kiritimatiellae bacterium]|nr:hypothetical protein [Kiritimatiellia bacterium]